MPNNENGVPFGVSTELPSMTRPADYGDDPAGAAGMLVDPEAFARIRREYRRLWKITIHAAGTNGSLQAGDACPDGGAGCPAARRHAIEEACRWGEPTVSFCPRRRMVWAVPVLHNARLLGGLIACTTERRVFPARDGAPAVDIRKACEDLRRLAEEENLTNAALLAHRREEYRREQQRAEAIHELKLLPVLDVREMYLREEPDLLAAIRRDDRPEARRIVNRILTAVYFRSGRRLDLIKAFFMELIVAMSRTAVEAGGNPEEVLGENFARLSALGRAATEEDLAPWLHETLEGIMDSIRRHQGQSHSALATAALAFMQEHFPEPIGRDDVARAVHTSGSHFSRLLKAQLGRSFSDLLTQIRVNHAAELLARTDKPLALVSLESGFHDQSYFTKVFRRRFHQTPGQYRQRQGQE